jgi:hypothetical protein
MDENEFELNGIQYVAVEDIYNEGCDSCSFNIQNTGCAFAPTCFEDERIDGRDVIFVEKHP